MLAIHVQTLEVGPLYTCCYLVAGEESPAAVAIDPGWDSEVIQEALASTERTLEMILLTHCHYDHIGAVEDLLEAFPDAVLACHAICGARIQDPIKNLSAPVMGIGGRVRAPDRTLAHDELFTAAGLTWHVHHVPGHTPGHVVYHVADAGALFAGDTLFAGSIGRTDLPDSDSAALLAGLRALLAALPPETRIYPGHGPATTVRNERKHNPYGGKSGC